MFLKNLKAYIEMCSQNSETHLSELQRRNNKSPAQKP